MPRYKLTIEYDGTPFVGWQVQENCPSVQGRICEAIEQLAGKPYRPRGAGRTDAGVHALGQVAHIDLENDWEVDVVRDALNAHLRPDPIAVLLCEQVDKDFDARSSATARHYLYRIVARRAPLTIDRNRVCWVPRPLDVDAMHAAAQLLVGHHDFTTFRSAHCQAKSPVKTLDRMAVMQVGPEVHVAASARSFMHNQVRSMVGSLQRVGDGKWPIRQIADALAAKDRAVCGPVAPPQGLYLERVDYD